MGMTGHQGSLNDAIQGKVETVEIRLEVKTPVTVQDIKNIVNAGDKPK